MESLDFLVRDFVSGGILDLSITSYADDVANCTLFNDGQELQQLVLAEDMALSDSLQRICTAQHTGKQEHTVSMRGRGSWADMQRIYTSGFLTGRVATSIKCLGCWLHHEGRQAQAIAFRVDGPKEAWSRSGVFLVQIWHFQTSAHHGVQKFDFQHAQKRIGNDGYEPGGVQKIERLHSWLCQKTRA